MNTRAIFAKIAEGIVIEGLAICMMIVLMLCMTAKDRAADEKAQAYSEAKMKARIFSMPGDRQLVSMVIPVKNKGSK